MRLGIVLSAYGRQILTDGWGNAGVDPAYHGVIGQDSSRK